MKSMSVDSQFVLIDSCSYAFDQVYTQSIEEAGNMPAYLQYIASIFSKLHNALSLDSDETEIYLIIDGIYYSAPWFN